MVDTQERHTTPTLRSVEIAFNIIEALQEQNQLGITELADELGHSKSTIHSHLQTLENREIVVNEAGKYHLSLRILDMANDVRNQVGNYDVIKEEADTLANETGEIAQFGLEEHRLVTYLYKSKGERGVETASSVGRRQPMHSTSLGKAILAYLPHERREEIINSMPLERKTPQTITDPEQLRAELDKITERGYAIDDEENLEGLRCVAAPVKNGKIVLGAISITGPASRITDDDLHNDLAKAVQRAANIIEVNTKFA